MSLNEDEILVGRVSNQITPDLAFKNAFISRKHLVIRKEKDRAVLYDLGSLHGTEINGVSLTPHMPYPLNNFDIIKLAKGMVVLDFSYMFADQTLDIEPLSLTRYLEPPELPLKIHWEKRECVVEGRKIRMSEKEYLLIRLLHDNANRLVSLEEIKSKVWPERSSELQAVTDVSLDELNALVYRVRKKYGKNTFHISAVRGGGYMLEEEMNSSYRK